MAEFQFTKTEYMAALTALSRRRLLLRFALLVLAGIMLSIGYALRSSDAGATLVGIWIAIAVACVATMFLFRWRVSRAFDELAPLREKIRADITTDGLKYTHETGHHELPWDRIRKWKETDRFIFLYEGRTFARILPKRALSGEELAKLHECLAGTKRI